MRAQYDFVVYVGITLKRIRFAFKKKQTYLATDFYESIIKDQHFFWQNYVQIYPEEVDKNF